MPYIKFIFYVWLASYFDKDKLNMFCYCMAWCMEYFPT